LGVSRIESFADMRKKCAIAVLTKGYNLNSEYAQLIARNQSIYETLYKHHPELYDVVIFHEGNITPEQQTYIQSATPKQPLLFKVVVFNTKLKTNESLCPPTPLSKEFSMGYKNMCHFWSFGFFNYLDKYDYVIRIDEDCIVNKIDPNIIDKYMRNGTKYSSPFFQGNDHADVIVGMETFFKSFMDKHNIKPKKDSIRCPYTNMFIMDISYFKRNNTIMYLFQSLDESNCIWSNRWGDLPIWGYILSYLIDENDYIEDKDIQYKHGSHNASINF
jgi:hypothetical protein